MNTNRPIPCPTCGYDLRGLVGPLGANCPECGSHCSRHEIAAILAPRQRLALSLGQLLTPVVMVLALAALSPTGSPRLMFAMAGIVGFAWAFYFCRDAAARIAQRRAAREEPHRAALLTWTTILAAATVVAWVVATIAALALIALVFLGTH